MWTSNCYVSQLLEGGTQREERGERDMCANLGYSDLKCPSTDVWCVSPCSLLWDCFSPSGRRVFIVGSFGTLSLRGSFPVSYLWPSNPAFQATAEKSPGAYFLPEFALSPQGSFLEDTTGEQFLTYRYDDQVRTLPKDPSWALSFLPEKLLANGWGEAQCRGVLACFASIRTWVWVSSIHIKSHAWLHVPGNPVLDSSTNEVCWLSAKKVKPELQIQWETVSRE